MILISHTPLVWEIADCILPVRDGGLLWQPRKLLLPNDRGLRHRKCYIDGPETQVSGPRVEGRKPLLSANRLPRIPRLQVAGSA